MNFIFSNTYPLLSLTCYVVLILLNFVAVILYIKKIEKYDSLYNLIFPIFLIIFIFVERYFSFFCNITNIDESFHLAIALKFVRGHDFWIDIDPSSVGPVNTLIFSLVYAFIGEMNYLVAKVSGFLILAISSLCLYFGFQKLASNRCLSQLLVSCFACYMVQPIPAMVVSYNSEYSIILLLSIWVFLYSRYQLGSVYKCLSYIVLGLMPFAKMQCCPVCLFLIIFMLTNEMIQNKDQHFISKIRNLSKFIFFISIPTVFVLLDSAIHGSFVWFVRFYILNMISYVNNVPNPNETMMNSFVHFWTHNNFLIIFSVINILLILINLFQKNYKDLILCFGVISLSIYETIKPAYLFWHYTNIMLVPLLLGIALLCKFELKNIILSKIEYLLLTFLIIYSSYDIYYFDSYHETKKSVVINSYENSVWTNIASYLKQNSMATDTMVVWGWCDKIYVYSQIPAGTAEIAIGGFIPSEFINRTYPAYTKEKFLADLIQNKPKFIIDTPSPITDFYDDYKYSIKNYADIYDYVSANYHISNTYNVLSNNNKCLDEVFDGKNNQRVCKINVYELN